MLCTNVVGCLSEIFILLFKSKDSNAMENLQLCLNLFFHPSGVFLLLFIYTALCACSHRVGAAVIPHPSFSEVPLNRQPFQAPRPLPRRKVVLVQLLCWTLSVKKKQFLHYLSGFCKTEAKPHFWVLEYGISQKIIDPKRCFPNVCSKARSGLDVNDGKTQTDSPWWV